MSAAPTPDVPPQVRADWDWARGHEAAAIEFVRRHVCKIKDSTTAQDLRQATDYTVTAGGNVAVAMRVRRISSVKSRRDFTLRISRPSGSKQEISKIAEGYADLYCYVWVNDLFNLPTLDEYMLVDMHRFRASGLLDRPDGARWNRDRSSVFAWWEWRKLQDFHCIVEGCKYPNSVVSYWIVTNYQGKA